MRLYTYFRSSAAYRVRIALNLKGLAYESVPVLLMSAASRPVNGTLADHFIHKPFDLNAVADLIEHYIAAAP